MTKTADYKCPLVGINVIDFGWYYAGPMAGLFLADQGANVIRIVKPGARELPDQPYRVLNRNKKLLELDLKTEEGKAEALSLIEKADVLIENFRPGVMNGLGLGYVDAQKINPGIIYLSLPGFSATDEKRASIQAWEGVISAATCMYTDVSALNKQLQGPPLYTSIAQCSVYGALHGVIAVMAALLAREECRRGTFIETPLVDAALSGFPTDFIAAKLGAIYATIPEKFKPYMYSETDSPEDYREKLAGAWEANQSIPHPSARYYECADGRLVAFYGALFPAWNDIFYKTLGIEKEVLKEGFVNAGPWIQGLDNNLSSYGGLSPEKHQYLQDLIACAFRKKKADEWETLLSDKVLFLLPRTREEWLNMQVMHQTGVFTTLAERGAELVAPGRAVDVSGPDGALMQGFEEFASISKAEAEQFFAGGRVSDYSAQVEELGKADLLKGLRIMDMSNVLAGPSAGYFLAQYGAEVIKIDQTETAPHLLKAVQEANQSKRSLLASFRSAPGQKLLRELLSQADLVMHNVLDDTAERLGIQQSQLTDINPDLVSCQLSCFGGSFRGGWETRLGIDTVAQAASGLLSHYGWNDKPVPHGGAAAGDITAGLGMAFSALLALWQKRTTGYAGEARTSLVRMINYYQMPWMISEEGSCDWGEAKGQVSFGQSATQRLYKCRDGWIYVGAAAGREAELAALVANNAQAGEAELEAAFLSQDVALWQTQLQEAGIGAHPVVTMDQLCDASSLYKVDNNAAEEMAVGPLKVMLREDHPCGSPVITPMPAWTRIGKKRSVQRLTPAPRYGAHSREILKELGYRDRDIAHLIQLGVVFESLPALGSKSAHLYEPA